MTVSVGLLHQVVVDCRCTWSAQFSKLEVRAVFVCGTTACDEALSACGQGRTFSAAGLNDEDILPAHALLDLDPRLAALELGQQHLCRRYAEVVADGPARVSRLRSSPSHDILCELRVRAAAEDDNVANHDAGGGVAVG